MRMRFHVRTLMFLTLMIALPLAVIAPEAYKALRRASACYLLGEVGLPSRIETFGVKLTVKDAIKAAGGLKPNANLGNIKLVRPSFSGEQVLHIDLNMPATNYILRPGDRLVVYRTQTQ